MKKESILTVFFLIVFTAINVEIAFSQDDEMLEKMAADEELQQELKWLKAETFVITASKVMENIKKAPASITVVTDRQIRQIGATNLVEVLRIVPGFTSWYTHLGINELGVRGGLTDGSKSVLLMVNSHPIHSVFSGGATWAYDTIIVDNIKRIEFIRGPGSALYGSNAFFGVINIITKEAEDVDGLELTARGGSWDTQQYNLLYGKTFSDLDVVFNFNYFKTHGFRGLIEEDSQTSIDREYYIPNGIPPASLAPGRTKGDGQKYDVALNLKYKGFTFNGRYVDRERDTPVSLYAALVNRSLNNTEDYYLTLSYETSIWEGLDFSGKLFRNVFEDSWDRQTLPPSWIATYPFGLPDFMPDGWREKGSYKSSRTGLEIQTKYMISESNTIVAGATFEEQKIYDISLKGNCSRSPNPDLFFKFPSVQDLPDEYCFDTERGDFEAIFFEDIWDITDDLRFTTGARYDHYSEFGGHFSPRVGLTWEYIKGYDLKLLYGHAFRAPSFFELYEPNNGNPDLDPTEIDTYEISLGAEVTSSFSSRITYYYRRTKDIIRASSFLPPWNYVNLGEERDHGFEVEAKYDFGRGTYLSGNYNYQSFNTGSTMQVGDVMANIRLSRYLNFNMDCVFWDGIERILPTDTRDDPPGGAVVFATLIAKKFLKGYEDLELRGTVNNLLDKDWSSPTAGPELPNDFPMPGRNYYVEIKYAF